MDPLYISVSSWKAGKRLEYTVSPELNKAGEFVGVGVLIHAYGCAEDLTKKNIAWHIGIWLQEKHMAKNNYLRQMNWRFEGRGYSEELAQVQAAHVPLVQLAQAMESPTQYLQTLNDDGNMVLYPKALTLFRAMPMGLV